MNGESLLAALKADGTIGSNFNHCTTAAQVAEVLAGFMNNSTNLDAFATIVGNNLGTVAGTSTDAGDTYTISNLLAGYYFVKDSAAVTG